MLFAPESLARQLAGPAHAPNQVTVYYTAAGRKKPERTDTALAAIARRHGATGVVTRSDQPSNALLSKDISGFAELAVMFPLLFLTAAGLAT